MTQIKDIYNHVTQSIIDDLEKGILTWRQPWSSLNLAGEVMRPLRSDGTPYKGINTIMLWAAGTANYYASPYWMTYKQARGMDAYVQKGEKGHQVVYADKFLKEKQKDDGSTETRAVPFLKAYTVFNASQIIGLPPRYYAAPEPKVRNKEERIAAIETFFAQTKAEVFTGPKAAYYIMRDRIEMPPFEVFDDAVSYYGTLAHETAHWTRHPSRLNRDLDRKKHGDEGYAREELVAELAACFLGADLGYEPVMREEHAAYIQSWLKVLKNDKRAIFQAATHAQKAAEYLHGLQQPAAAADNTSKLVAAPGM